MFVTLGGAALIHLLGSGDGVGSIPIDHDRLVTNPTLPTIPLFTLAGYLASYRRKKPMPEVYRAVVPMILVLLLGVIVITYWPGITTWLPELLRG